METQRSRSLVFSERHSRARDALVWGTLSEPFSLPLPGAWPHTQTCLRVCGRPTDVSELIMWGVGNDYSLSHSPPPPPDTELSLSDSTHKHEQEIRKMARHFVSLWFPPPQTVRQVTNRLLYRTPCSQRGWGVQENFPPKVAQESVSLPEPLTHYVYQLGINRVWVYHSKNKTACDSHKTASRVHNRSLSSRWFTYSHTSGLHLITRHHFKAPQSSYQHPNSNIFSTICLKPPNREWHCGPHACKAGFFQVQNSTTDKVA